MYRTKEPLLCLRQLLSCCILMCMFICINASICTYIHTCVSIHMCVCIYVYTHVSIYMYIYMYIYVYVYVCIYVHICKHMHTLTYIHIIYTQVKYMNAALIMHGTSAVVPVYYITFTVITMSAGQHMLIYMNMRYTYKYVHM